MAGAAASVAELLNAAQDSKAASERCAGALWKLINVDTDKHYGELLECADMLLAVSQKSPHVANCIKCFGHFASKAPGSEVATAVVEGLLTHLAGRTAAADKTVRFHACQLLQQLLLQLPDAVLEDDSVLDTLSEELLERLQDKQPGVRAEAVKALCNLSRHQEDNDDIIEALTALLEYDKSKDVRVAVVMELTLDTSTLPVLLQRARDVSPVVRKALVSRLKGQSIKVLSIEQRASVIQQLLQDREADVAEAAAHMLSHWLHSDCAGDPLQLLQLLDVEMYAGAAACALESLITHNSIRAPGQQAGRSSQPSIIGYVKAAAAAGGPGGSADGPVGLRALCQQQGGRLLEPHEALLWRCLCEWLQTDAISRGLAAAATGGANAAVQAAVAAERHEALEMVLPESADELMGLVMTHAAAGPRARFAATQLLLIAAKCMEWTDAASRDTAAPFLQQLIALDPTRDDANAAGTAGTYMDTDSGSSARGGRQRTAGAKQQEEEDEEEGEESAGLQLSGNGGDGMFEAAVVQLVAAMEGSGGGFLAAMLDGTAALAAAAGLLRKPAAGGAGGGADAEGAEQRHAMFTVGAADSAQVLQVLCYLRTMLQQLPLRQQGAALDAVASNASISFSSLWELLLLLVLKQEQALVRAKAVECVGLYAQVAAAHNPGLLTAAVSLLGPLLAAEGSTLVRAAAVRALADIALLYGPAAVDSVLRQPAAAGVPAGAAETSAAGAAECEAAGQGQDADADSGSDGSSRSGRGVLELLLDQAESLLSEAQAGAAGGSKGSKSTKGGRTSTKAKQTQSEDAAVLSSSTADLMAAVSEALAKLLLHQRAWLKHYPAGPDATGALDSSQADAATAAAGVTGRPLQVLLLRRALALLLQLQFHPATTSVAQMSQALSVFFDVFSAASEANRLQLAAACLPAARQALHISSKRHPAPLLVRYVLQLLQQQQEGQQEAPVARTTQGAADTKAGFASVAHQLLSEVTQLVPVTVGAGRQPAKYKPYLSALLKVVCALPLDFTSSSNTSSDSASQDLVVLQAMANNLSVLISDASLSKDVAALQQHLQTLAEGAGLLQGNSLSEQALSELVAGVSKLSLQQLPALPDDIAAAAAAAAEGGGGVGAGAAAAGRSSRGRKVPGTSAAAAAAAPVKAGRGRASASATRAAAAAAARKASAAASSTSDEDSSSSSDGNAGSSGSGSDGSSSDDGSDAVQAPAAPPAANARRRSAAAATAAAIAVGRVRGRASNAAAAAASSSGSDGDDSDSDSDAFETADEESDEGVDGAVDAAAAADNAGDVASAFGDSGSSDESDENADSPLQEAPPRRQPASKRGVSSGKAGAAAAAAASTAAAISRRPLAPSNATNRAH